MAIVFDVGFRLTGDDLNKAVGPQIQTIAKEISNAFNVPIGKGMSSELTKAVHAAQTLEGALRKATTDKGISFATLQSELRKSGTSAQSLVATLASAGPEFAGSFNIALQSLSQANRQAVQLSNKIKEMQRVMVQSIKFTAAQDIQRAFTSSVSEAIRWVKDLNGEIANISVVTGKTGKDLDKVYTTIIEGSKKLRTAAKDYAEGALIYYQQGLSDEEVQRRTEITIQSAKAAGVSVQTMSQQLTAIWNTYKMVGDEQQRAASVGASLAANTAVEFSDIAEAMQVAAAAGEQMGVSYNSLAAIIATVGDATQQSASVIGNAYKTIFSRFQQLTTTGTDGEVTLGLVSSKLSSLGVNVLDAAGKLRDLDTVIMEVGEGWNKFTQEQQLAIAQLVGGTRQYGQFLSLMNNFDKYKANLSIANLEDGSTLEKQYQNAQKTIETAAVNAKEAWSRAFSEIFQEEAFIKMYNVLEKAGDAVDHMIDGLGGMPGILTLVATILSRKIVPTISQGGAMLKDYVTNLTQAGAAANAKKEASSMRAQTQQAFAISKNGASDQQKIQLGFQETAANLKLDQYEKVTGAMYQINKMLNSNSEQMKIQGKYLKDQIDRYQTMYNTNVDLVAKTQARAQREKEIAETIMKQNNGATPTGAQAAAISANNSRINRLNYQNQQEQGKIDRIQHMQTELSRPGSAMAQGMSTQEIAKQQQYLAEQLKIKQQIIEKNNEEINQLQARNNTEMLATKALQERRAAQAGIQKIVAELKLKVAELAQEQDKVFDAKDADNYFKQLQSHFRKLGIDIQQIDSELEQAFSQLSTGGKGEQSEMSVGLDRIKAVLDSLSEDDEIDLNINTDGLDEIGEQVEGARQGLHGLDVIVGQAQSKLVGLQLSTTEVASSMVSLGTNAIYLTTSLTNMSNSLQEGDLMGFAAGLTALSFQIPSMIKGIQTLTTAMVALNTVKSLSNKISQNGTTQLLLEEAAKAANVTITEGMTAAQVKEAFAAKGVTIALGEENGVVSANTVVTGINAAAWWAHPVVLVLVGAVMAVVAAFGIWNAVIKNNIEQAQKSVDKHRENIDKINETTNALEENTKAVEDNANAYREALTSGENVSETYERLSDSLTKLNDSLLEAGVSQEKLSQAMSNALATGDMESYYEILRQESASLFKQKMEEYAALNAAQVSLAKAEMTKAFDFNGPEKTTIADTVYGEGGEVILEPSQALKDIAAKSDLFSEKGGTITLNLEFDNASDFREQYQNLVNIRKELEKTGANKSELAEIDKQIEGMTENYNALEEQIKEAQAALEGMFKESVAWQTSEDGGGMNLEGMDLNAQGEYLSSMYAQLQQYGESIGMTSDEIEQSFRNIVATVPELNSALASLDQAKTISSNIFQKQNIDGDGKAITDYMNRIKELQKMQEEAATKTGIGEWLNGLSAEEEYWRDMGISAEEAAKEIEEAQRKIEEFEEIQRKIQEKFNSLDKGERDILLKAGVEFIDDEDDIQQTLDAFKDLELKVNLKIKNKDQLEAEINQDNALQEGLSKGIEEFQKTGMVSVDTAKAMIDSGLSEYLMVVDDHFVLTTGAANAYNGSLEREKDNVQALLELQTELRAPTQEFAETMTALSATLDNVGLEKFVLDLQGVAVEFLNSEGSAQDMIHYFQELQRVNTEAVSVINQNLDNLSTDQIHQMYNEMEALGNNLASTMQQANNAFAAGEMTMSEYRGALRAAGEAQAASAQNALALSKAQVKSAKAALDEAKANGASEKQLESLQKDLKQAQDDYKKTSTAVTNFNKKLKDFAAFDSFTSAIETNKEVLEGFLNDDFTLAIDIAELDQTQLTALESAIEGTFDTISQLSQEGTQEFLDNIYNMIGTAEGQLSQAEADMIASLVTQVQNHEITAAEGLQAIQTQAGDNASTITSAFLNATATQNEGQIKSTSQAIGSILEAVGQAITNFEAKLEVVPSGSVSIVPTWGNMFDLGWKLISGKKVTAGVEGNLAFDVTGSSDSLGNVANALSNAANFFNTNDGGGSTDGKPSLGDYDTKTPTAADPTDFNTPEGTGSSKKGGGGSKSKTPEYKEQERNEDIGKKYEERYTNIDSAIKEVTQTLEKLNDAEEDAWGAQKVRNLQAINRQLSIQNRNYSERLRQARAWLEVDKANLLSISKNRGAKGLGLSDTDLQAMFKFNDNGSIANRETIIRQLYETYVKPFEDAANALIDDYNTKGVGDDTATENIEKANQKLKEQQGYVETIIELMDQVDETSEEIYQTWQNIINGMREMVSGLVKEIQTKYEFRIRIDDRDLTKLSNMIDRLGEAGVVLGDTFDKMWEKADAISKKLSDVGRSFSEADNLLNEFISAGSGADQAMYDQVRSYFFGKNLSEDEAARADEMLKAWLDGNAAMPEEIMSFMQDLRDEMVDVGEELVDHGLEMLDNIMTQVNNWFDKTFGEADHIIELSEAKLDLAQRILDFKGTSNLTVAGRQANKDIMAGRMNVAQATLDRNMAEKVAKQDYVKELEKSISVWENVMKTANEGTLEYNNAAAQRNALYQEREEAMQAIQDLETEIVNSTTEIIEIAAENIEKEKEIAKANIAIAMNGLFSDISDMMNMYSIIDEEKNLTLDDYDKNYHLNRLQNKYNDAIEDLNPEQLEKLQDWQERLNKYKEEGVEMTQSEVDLLEKALEVEMARADFEDQRNNKNTMRLQRDASGNYAYVYSGDGASSEESDKLAQLEYEYKKLLEQTEDAFNESVMNTAEKLQQEIENIDYQLYYSSELYRRSVDVKISSLVNQMEKSGAAASQVLEIMGSGVKGWEYDFSQSTAGVITQTTSMQGMLEKFKNALVGPDGYIPGSSDKNTYYGAIMEAQRYWAEVANTKLQESTGETFGFIDEDIKGHVVNIAGPNGYYHTLIIETQEVGEIVDGVLVSNQDSVTNKWNEAEGKIHETIGDGESTDPNTVNGNLNILKNKMTEIKNHQNTQLNGMLTTLANFTTSWEEYYRRQVAAVQSLIDKMAEYENRARQQMDDEPDVSTGNRGGNDPQTPTTPPITGGPVTTPPTGGDNGGGEDLTAAGAAYDHGVMIYEQIHYGRDGVGPSGQKSKTGVESTKNGVNKGVGYKWPVGGSLRSKYAQDLGFTSTEYQIAQDLFNKHYPVAKRGQGLSWEESVKQVKAKYGLYTGGLVTEPGTYNLAEKGPEIVLNAKDTENILAAVSLMRQTVQSQFGGINGSLLGVTNGIASAAQTFSHESQTVDQQVRIEASFPGVSVAQEIEDALNSLITQAAQYNIKK